MTIEIKTLSDSALASITGGQGSDAWIPLPHDGAIHLDYSKPETLSTTCRPFDNNRTQTTGVVCTTTQSYQNSRLFKPQPRS